MAIKDGLHDIPAGKLAAVVTYLKMEARPDGPMPEAPEGVTLERLANPPLARYRALFRKVGAPWLWFSRLRMVDRVLELLLSDPRVEVYVLRKGDEDQGIVELDFRLSGQCELAFFGLAPGLEGQGIGRWMMARAIDMAWREGVTLFHVHTCTLDSPAALPFYIRSGFVPVRRQVELADDPRTLGCLPEDAAPQVPLIR